MPILLPQTYSSLLTPPDSQVNSRISTPSLPSSQNLSTQSQLNQLLNHISLKWSSLLRSNLSILDLLNDPKIPNHQLLYIHSSEPLNQIKSSLLSSNPLGDLDQVHVLELPDTIQEGKHGALYLPYPYVVPGGVFQEMYAWDSFFIAVGLIRDKQYRLARNILDNHIYQIEKYGKILNGNRTYYLTRSQLPLLTPLIKLIYPIIPSAHSQGWLKKAISASEKYYEYWVTGEHLIPETGLSRFFDTGPTGSIPPEIAHEVDPNDGASAYERVRRFYKENHEDGIADYDITEYYDVQNDKLTDKYMDSDRAMRESGFDTSHRFGPFNAKILDFNPVCLNSLLVQMEEDLSLLYTMIQSNEPSESEKNSQKSQYWSQKAQDRKQLMQKYNWDEEDGLFYDYDFVRKSRRKYKFGTTFLPLWTGLATPIQAEKVVKSGLRALEIQGGLATSDQNLGSQWDMPYAWAPLQFFAVDGMRRYGFSKEADRLSINFGSMVLKTFLKTGEVWEKYDAVRRDETVKLKYGYPTNEIGFGWTNAVFTRFYDQLSSDGKENLLRLDGLPIPSDRE
ncbi:trehalase-domain-containing protein [Melampsora americana]|nr:trehalase-domain-containing protein [Melampsora americana]